MSALTLGSCFSGLGGLELGIVAGLRSAGVPVRVDWQIENNPACQEVLRARFPEATLHDDIRTATPAPVSVVVGGWPCQGHSLAGKGAGLADSRSGLFFSMARIVRAMDPRPNLWIMENVSSVIGRGLPAVLGEVASLGYSARWAMLRADDPLVGAPHRRERWFCVAWRVGYARTLAYSDLSGHGRTEQQSKPARKDWTQARTDTQKGAGRTQARSGVGSLESGLGGCPDGASGRLVGRWPAGPGCRQHDWEPGRTHARQPGDKQRLRMLGNAVVPQQAYWIGRWAGLHLIRPV